MISQKGIRNSTECYPLVLYKWLCGYDHCASRRMWWNHKWAMKMNQYIREGRLYQEIVKWGTNLKLRRWRTEFQNYGCEAMKVTSDLFTNFPNAGRSPAVNSNCITGQTSISPFSSNRAFFFSLRAMSPPPSYWFLLLVWGRSGIASGLGLPRKLDPTQAEPMKVNDQELLELLWKANSLSLRWLSRQDII